MEIPLEVPDRGLMQAVAFSKIPPRYSTFERNWRVLNPVTGRWTGATRAGHSKFCSTRIDAAAPIKAMQTVKYDVANITWANKPSALTAADIVKSWDTPSKTTSKRNRIDRYGNEYQLDGKAGLIKYTSKGAEVWRINFPTAHDDHEIRAFWIDDFLNVYAAVSFGTQGELARLWKYEPDIENEGSMKLKWTWEPGGFVPDLTVHNEKLYYLVNFHDTGKAHIVALEGLERVLPLRTFTQPQAPYPSNALAVGGNEGAIYTTHEPVAVVGRGKNPQAPDADAVFVSWTPRDLTDAPARIFSWFAADNADGLANSTLEHGSSITRWFDISGNGRHRYTAAGEQFEPTSGAADVTCTSPTLDTKAQAGLPGIRFNGLTDLMRSAPNISDEYNARDTQGTTVPAHRTARDTAGAAIANTGSAYLRVMAVKIDLDSTGTVARFLWSHQGADNGTTDRHFLVNKTSNPLTGAGSDILAADKGRFAVFEATAGPSGNGPGGRPASGNAAGDFGDDDNAGPVFGDAFDNTSGVAIISYLCDGGFQSGTYNTTTTHSFLRINGRPIDRFRSAANFTKNPDYIGGTGITAGTLPAAAAGTLHRFFKGWILEDICLTRKPINLSLPTTEDIVVEHTKYGFSTVPVAGDTDWPGAGVAQSDTELAKLEAYMGGRWGKKASTFPGLVTEYAHPYQTTVALAPNQPATANVNNLLVARGILAKWGGDSGVPIWSVDANEPQGGIGYDVIIAPSGWLYTYGPGSGLARFVLRINDLGSQPEVSGGTTWANSLGMSSAVPTFEDKHPKLAVDASDNLYVPVIVDPAAGTAPNGDVIVLSSAGATLHNFNRVGGGTQWLAYSCAVPPSNPPYPSSLASQRALTFYASGKGEDQAAADIVNTVQVQMVTETVNTGPPREEVHIAVAGGNIKTFTNGGVVATPSGGAAAVDTNARYVELLPFVHEGTSYIFVMDGKNYWKFDPKADTVTAWEATAGEVPPRGRIGCVWNNRVLIGRGDDPDLFFMSKKGNPFDFDRIPLLQTVTQSIFIEDRRVGRVPDIVSALIPASETELIIGCDHSILKLVGEPLLSDQYYVVSDTIGIAWNSSWTRDPLGAIYFFSGTDSQVYRLVGNGIAPISQAIPERLRSIDLATNRVVLEWSTRFRGLHVKVVPALTPTVVLESYFWEAEVDAWHPDQPSALPKMGTAFLTVDGDSAADRFLLVGTVDGWILKEDTSADDDGQAIESRVRWDAPRAALGHETRVTGFSVVLSDSLAGAFLNIYGSNEPDVTGPPRRSRKLTPGRNARWNEKVTAAHVQFELASAMAGQRFAFEEGTHCIYPAGRLRPKARESTVGVIT